MKKIILLLMVLFTCQAFAADWYVNILADPGGDGTTDATSSGDNTHAFDTMVETQPDISSVDAGDTVYVAPGDYGLYEYRHGATGGDSGRVDYITYIGGTIAGYGDQPIIRYLHIQSTPSSYMKFKNFKILEQAGLGSGSSQGSLEVEGQDATTKRCDHVEFYDCLIETTFAQANGARGVRILYADNVLFQDCEIIGGHKALFIASSATDITFNNTIIRDSWEDLVSIYATEIGTTIDDVTFDGCTFDNAQYIVGVTGAGLHVDYIQTSATNNTDANPMNRLEIRNSTFIFDYDIAWDDIEDSTYAGVQPQAHGTGFVFENNVLRGLSKGSGFKFAIHDAGEFLDDVVVRNNTFGVTPVPGGSDTVVYMDQLKGLVQHNNIYHSGITISTPTAEVTQNNNIYSSYNTAGGDPPSIGGNSSVIGVSAVEALFTDFNGDVFTLALGSFATGFGDSDNQPTLDIVGTTRLVNPNADAGAYVEQNPPTPNPAEWLTEPMELDDDRIFMSATPATDETPPIKYRFFGTDGGGDSGFTTSPNFTDSGLTANTTYNYTVQTQDAIPNTGTASAPAAATTDAAPNTDAELIHRWKLDEPSGRTVLVDSVGATILNMQLGSFISVNGPVDTASRWAGATSAESIRGGVTLPDSAMSISMWVRTTRSGTPQAVSFDAASGAFLSIQTRAGIGVAVEYDDAIGGGNDVVSTSPTISNGLWRHVVLVITDGNKFQIYVDGSKEGENLAMGVTLVTLTRTFVAQGEVYEGDLDDIRIYDGILTEQEIQDLFDAGDLTESGYRFRFSFIEGGPLSRTRAR